MMIENWLIREIKKQKEDSASNSKFLECYSLSGLITYRTVTNNNLFKH